MKNLFWTTISCIRGVGSKTFLQLYEQHPSLTFDTVLSSVEHIEQTRIRNLLTEENIDVAKEKAERLIQTHEEKGIETIPFSSDLYPKYLRLIPDPPPIIFAKGNVALLKEKKQLAIVGTREPTPIGYKASQKIAKTFAEKGYVIVSGLALGIDTAAHEGALMADDGKTISILAGNLTEVYPAQNRGLVEQILERDGLLLSETPIGQANTRGNFVKRDRIQSGLSLGVCPVQTPLKSGTQHTINFAKKQGRFLFTPIPLAQDLDEKAVEGNLELIKQGVAVLENKDSYEKLSAEMLRYMEKLDLEHEQRFAKKDVSEQAESTEANDKEKPAEITGEQLTLFD